MAKKRQYVPSAYKIKEPERLDFYTQLMQYIQNRKDGKAYREKQIVNTTTTITIPGGYKMYYPGYNTMLVPIVLEPKCIENTIKELTKKRLITQKKYSWVTDGNIMNYISSENEELFLIGYTILEHKKVL